MRLALDPIDAIRRMRACRDEPPVRFDTLARRWRLSVVALSLTACAGESAPVAPGFAPPGTVTALSATPVAAKTVAGTAYVSSTKLGVAWTAPNGVSVERYAVTWTDQLTQKHASASSATTSLALGDLKAATPYRIHTLSHHCPCVHDGRVSRYDVGVGHGDDTG